MNPGKLGVFQFPDRLLPDERALEAPAPGWLGRSVRRNQPPAARLFLRGADFEPPPPGAASQSI